MTLRPFELLRRLDRETKQTKSKIAASRSKNIERTDRMQRLTERQTDAFVELARHYLPELSHNSLADAWAEVREQIRDLLLQKEDRRRTLIASLQETRSQREQLEQDRASEREQLDRARLILSCKTGNYKKMMREDSSIVESLHRIEVIDEEIECGLSELERVERDAIKKLPAYEQCTLFQYLHQREFGTPRYAGGGLERRWDRWVARLIDYEKAKAGFDHLTEAPEHLRGLIAAKQTLYRDLLSQLESARANATARFGVAQQTETWQVLSKRVAMLDESIEQSGWTESCLMDDLYAIENINGPFYDQSIEVYLGFLKDLDPAILKVYAACTESPVDDEICARVRNIQSSIASQHRESKRRQEHLEQLGKYVAGLSEISERLRDHLRSTPADVVFGDELCFGDLVQDLKRRTRTPGEVWRLVRKSMVSRTVSGKAQSLRSFEAALLASSDLSTIASSVDQPDRSGVVLLKGTKESVGDESLAYAPVAVCRSEREADDVAVVLSDRGLKVFVCEPNVSYQTDHPDDELQGEVHVMVQVEQIEEAYAALLRRQQSIEARWECGNCNANIDRGYGVCHHCGNHRSESCRTN